MLTFDEFQQAIRLDFTDISDDGSEFECLVQELLQAMGFDAQRTGVGPDLGADIIAEETLLDKLGVKQTRKYIVQCKHYAHSKKALGTGDVADITDTLSRNNANGYLLVSSTDISTSLRRKLTQLSDSNPNISILIWDHLALEQQLNNYPVIVTRYFPTRFQQLKIALPHPKGRKESYVRDRIQAHIREYVGSKFIPKLYVKRYVEESLQNSLLSSIKPLQHTQSVYRKELETYIADVRKFLTIPSVIRPGIDPSSVFSWTVDFSSLDKQIKDAEAKLLSLEWTPVNDYIRGGCVALQAGFDSLVEGIRDYIKFIEAYMDTFLVAASNIEEREREIVDRRQGRYKDKNWILDQDTKQRRVVEQELRKEKVDEFKNSYEMLKSEMTDEEFRSFINQKADEFLTTPMASVTITTRVRGKLSAAIDREVEKLFFWRDHKFITTNKYNLSPAEVDNLSNVQSFSSLKQQLLAARQALKHNPIPTFKDTLRQFLKAIQVVVDIAGSGKTNLCCRLALNFVNKAYVIFITGKSFGKEYTSIESYIEREIRTALHKDKSTNLAALCQLLQQIGYPLIVILDGVNESPNPQRMKLALQELIHLASSLPIRVLLTSRTEYWSYFSDTVFPTEFASVISGSLTKFTEDEHSIAIPVYLDHYRLDVRLESKAWEQLKRPLLLRFFCEAYGEPTRTSYRRMPPIKEVRLFRLFGEYCQVKYKNIQSKLNDEGHSVNTGEVEEVTNYIAHNCLRNRKRRLSAKSTLKALASRSSTAIPIYRRLLDEDIIIEETLERRDDILERYVSFVYEAFMEYLMSRVLLQGVSSDSRLYRRVKDLLDDEQQFVHVRGILAFLLPFCVEKYPKTYQLIISQFHRSEYAETCVPAILNLWDSDWKKGIWPVLQAASQNFLAVPMEQVATFLQDWLSEHDGRGFMVSAQDDPRVVISIFNNNAPKIITSIKAAADEDVVKALIKLLSACASEQLAFDILTRISNSPAYTKETIVFGKNLWESLLNASLHVLEAIKLEPASQRDWGTLDILSEIGERWAVGETDIPTAEAEKIFAIVRQAIFDELCNKIKVRHARKWWADILKIDCTLIEQEVEEWLLDPEYTEMYYNAIHLARRYNKEDLGD